MNLQRGHDTPFREWARIIYDRVRKELPDVHAAGNGREVTISRGTARVTLANAQVVWWVMFYRGEGSPMPPLAIEQHDTSTAANTAKTIAGFFDAQMSRPDSASDPPAPSLS